MTSTNKPPAEGRIYVVNKREAGAEVFVGLVRANHPAQAIRHIMKDTLTAHVANGNEVAALMHHGGIRDARRDAEDLPPDVPFGEQE